MVTVAISIHASRVGGDQISRGAFPGVLHFNPRLPSGRRHSRHCGRRRQRTAFQSTPPEWEATLGGCGVAVGKRVFQSTPPEWEATERAFLHFRFQKLFQSTPPEWEATCIHYCTTVMAAISIHASRVGGDRHAQALILHMVKFQSTPPEWEATHILTTISAKSLFQSTPPEWEATGSGSVPFLDVDHFNPRLPSGRRLGKSSCTWFLIDISIHASRVGGDTAIEIGRLPTGIISIHASRVGGDLGKLHVNLDHNHFNPRLPSGRRLQKSMKNGRILWNFC